MDNEEKIKEMEEQISNLETELQATKEHLKKYTAPASRKVYYENNKEAIKERVKKCREKTTYKSTPEQRKERPACFQISSFTSSNNQKEEEKVRPS